MRGLLAAQTFPPTCHCREARALPESAAQGHRSAPQAAEPQSLRGPDSTSTSRRGFLGACLQAAALLSAAPLAAHSAPLPPAPPTGDCPECIGEVHGGLNACQLNSPSCVSTQNDDERHFIPPWTYEGSREEAVEALLQAATGQALQARLETRHRTADGSEYLHLVLGETVPREEAIARGQLLDAEFLFPDGDSIATIRAGSREAPGALARQLSLSLSDGLILDSNIAKRRLEELRQRLRWEVAPVLTDFDPRYNQSKPLFFERLYQPFLRAEQKTREVGQFGYTEDAYRRQQTNVLRKWANE